MQKQFFVIITLFCFSNFIYTTDKKPQQSYQDKINALISIIEKKSTSELCNEATIIATGMAAGFKTYGYLASYAMLANPYANGAIHYAAFKTAYYTCLTTIASLRYAQQLAQPDNEEPQEDEQEEKSALYDEERYPFNLF